MHEKKKSIHFLFKTAEFEVQTPALSAGKPARREDFSRRKIVVAATSGWATVGPFVLGAPAASQKAVFRAA